MTWPFKKRKQPDWRNTGRDRWNEIKRQGRYVVERLECEIIDMDSGATEWRPKRDLLICIAGGEGITERVRNLDE